MMKKCYAFCLLLFPAMMMAQSIHFYPSNYIKVFNGSDTLQNAFAGGFSHPMFYNVDLNKDGLKDLVVFDRSDNRISCFMAKRGGTSRYEYTNKYEGAFPYVRGWMIMADYNHDEKPDIFTMSADFINTTGLTVYKNISDDKHIAFIVAKQSVNTCSGTGNESIEMNHTEIPAVVDVDGDGDLDVLTYAGQTSSVTYYQNQSMERYHNTDSMEFAIADECWGKYFEYPDSVNVNQLASPCDESFVCHKKEHSGSSMLAYDYDSDGDIDLVVGDAGYPQLNLLINGRNPTSAHPLPRDSMVSQISNFPPGNNLSIHDMPQPSLVDVDNDGVNDLVIAPGLLHPTQDSDFVWYYHTYPNTKPPVYKFMQKDFLLNTMIDNGSYSVPAFCDYNHDGLPDLLLSVSSGLGALSPIYDSRLYLYRNTGTKTKAIFSLEDKDYLHLAAKKMKRLHPAFADLDGDGKEDLLMGTLAGNILFYKNIGSGSLSAYSDAPDTLRYDDNGVSKPINVVSGAAPAVGDINHDGKLDLLVGSGYGKLYYFKNISTDNKIIFQLITDDFGNTYENGVYSFSPFIGDLDKNGHPDLLLGDTYGLRFYKDIDSTGNLTLKGNFIYNYAADSFSNINMGADLAPAIALLDGDYLPDLIVGNRDGGLQLFTGKDHGNSFTIIKALKPQQFSALKIFPNPARHLIHIQWEGDRDMGKTQINILDVTGRICKQLSHEASRNENNISVNVENLSPGIYFINMQQAGYLPSNKTFIILP